MAKIKINEEYIEVDDNELLDYIKTSTEIINGNSQLTLDLLQMMIALMNTDDINLVKQTIGENSKNYLDEYTKLTEKYEKYNNINKKFQDKINKE